MDGANNPSLPAKNRNGPHAGPFLFSTLWNMYKSDLYIAGRWNLPQLRTRDQKRIYGTGDNTQLAAGVKLCPPGQ